MQKRLLLLYVLIGAEGRLLHGVQDHLQAVQITSENQQLDIQQQVLAHMCHKLARGLLQAIASSSRGACTCTTHTTLQASPTTCNHHAPHKKRNSQNKQGILLYSIFKTCSEVAVLERVC